MKQWIFSRHYQAGSFWERIATHAVNDVRFSLLTEKQRQLAARVFSEVRQWRGDAKRPSRVFNPPTLMLEDKREEGR
jgi:hypothetical protein